MTEDPPTDGTDAGASAGPSPTVATARRITSIAVLVLLVLHVWPIPGDPEWILLGFMPWDLAYPLLWMAAASVVVLYMTGPAWPDEPPPDPRPPVGDSPGGPTP